MFVNNERGGQELTGRILRQECSWQVIGPKDWGLGGILPVSGAGVLGWIGGVSFGAKSANVDELPFVNKGITLGVCASCGDHP